MSTNLVPPEINLVHYSDPVLVKPHEELLPSEDGFTSNVKVEEILNCILPPRKWDENGKRWKQIISNQQIIRPVLVKLAETLDANLQHLQTRQTGICPIRRAIYSQLFDEMIRQVTINCSERGLLLMRIRDELKMTMDAYRLIYESGNGLRKPSRVENNLDDSRKELTELEVVKQKTRDDLELAVAKYKKAQRQGIEQLMVGQLKHDEEVNFLNKSNKQIIVLLEGFTTEQKKIGLK